MERHIQAYAAHQPRYCTAESSVLPCFIAQIAGGITFRWIMFENIGPRLVIPKVQFSVLLTKIEWEFLFL